MKTHTHIHAHTHTHTHTDMHTPTHTLSLSHTHTQILQIIFSSVDKTKAILWLHLCVTEAFSPEQAEIKESCKELMQVKRGKN